MDCIAYVLLLLMLLPVTITMAAEAFDDLSGYYLALVRPLTEVDCYIIRCYLTECDLCLCSAITTSLMC